MELREFSSKISDLITSASKSVVTVFTIVPSIDIFFRYRRLGVLGQGSS